jgi:aldose 1-epimerase
MKLEKTAFGKTQNDEIVELYTLTNDNQLTTRITNYGGIIVSLFAPDRNGNLADVVLGFDSLESYLPKHPYFGAICGRYANRIANGRFSLNGKEFVLPQNNGTNCLHGGLKGFDKKAWQANGFSNDDGVGVRLNYISPDGEEGFPASLDVVVTYLLRNDNVLQIEYDAVSDGDTVLNLTNHSYFNLAGGGDILNHEIVIDAERYMAADERQIPIGLRKVEGTPFDFRKLKRMGDHIDAENEQIKIASGYDHSFEIEGEIGALRFAARVVEPTTGRMLEVFTTEPAAHFYTGNNLKGNVKGKGGAVYKKWDAFCVETQHYADSPNQPDLPTTLLRKGETFSSTTLFKFGVI